MPCFKFSGSCSLCPWCGYECPLDSNLEKKKYYLYAHDRKGSYLDVLKSSTKKQDIIDTLNKMIAGTYKGRGLYQGVWAKKYQYTSLIDTTRVVRGWHPTIDVQYVPVIELTIADGDCNWSTDVELMFDIVNNKLYYKGSYIRYGQPIEFGKEWNGKLVFKRKA